MELNDIVTALLSLVAVIGSIYTYIVHNKRLNNQQRQINDYEIKKLEEERLEKKQALVEANVYKSGGIWKMKIFNRGKARATNIRFESKTLDEDSSIRLNYDLEMYPIPSLLPNDSVEITVILCNGHKPVHKMLFTWDDESGAGRSQEQDVIFDVS